MTRTLQYRQAILCCLTLLCLLGSSLTSYAQGSVKQAQGLAQALSQQTALPINVRLRFQIMGKQLPVLDGKGDAKGMLAFFSTTRILFWNDPASTGAAQNMRELEQQFVQLAKPKGFNLDLPPVGYSTAGAGAVAAPSSGNVLGGSQGALLVNRSTREELAELTLRAEEMGTAALAERFSAQLLALRDSLTVLRLDLADDQVSSEAVRNVLKARAEFLAGDGAGLGDTALRQKMDLMADALRTNFPPQVLRQARGSQVRL